MAKSDEDACQFKRLRRPPRVESRRSKTTKRARSASSISTACMAMRHLSSTTSVKSL